MKKALVLAGLFLCVTGLYAAETQDNQAAEGRKRNEEAYERILQQTGWQNASSDLHSGGNSEHTNSQKSESSPSKSS